MIELVPHTAPAAGGYPPPLKGVYDTHLMTWRYDMSDTRPASWYRLKYTKTAAPSNRPVPVPPLLREREPEPAAAMARPSAAWLAKGGVHTVRQARHQTVSLGLKRGTYYVTLTVAGTTTHRFTASEYSEAMSIMDTTMRYGLLAIRVGRAVRALAYGVFVARCAARGVVKATAVPVHSIYDDWDLT